MSLMKASHAETTHRAVIEIPKTLDDRLGEDAQSPGGGGGQEAAESPDLNAEPSAVGSAGGESTPTPHPHPFTAYVIRIQAMCFFVLTDPRIRNQYELPLCTTRRVNLEN